MYAIRFFCLLPALLLLLPVFPAVCLAAGQLEITVVDKQSGAPIACRMHLRDANGRARRPTDRTLPFWHDHFCLPGKTLLRLPPGNYEFELERGPEYRTRYGHFTIQHFADDSTRVELERCADMAAEGWYSGDLDVQRSPREIELLMAADDLHFAQLFATGSGAPANPSTELVTRFDSNRYFSAGTARINRAGTELLVFHLDRLPAFDPADGEYPPTVGFLLDHRGNGRDTSATGQLPIWTDAARPFAWDLPLLLAHGQVDSIQVAHGQLCRDTVLDSEGEGKPRDRERYRPPWGSGRWSHDIYFRVLECGFRIPPTAGSASGSSPNPVGYNRVYVHIEGEPGYDAWWRSLWEGRAMVTNGPLLRPSVRGQLPGHVFQFEAGETVEFQIGLTLSTREPISYLEIIQNGEVRHSIPFHEYAKSGRFPSLTFDRSGWFLLRAVTDLPKTFRFAMTAPWYVEVGRERRVSRSAVQFFLDWVYERARAIEIANPEHRREVLAYHRAARDFWQALLQKSNAE
ncbi:MAG: hypothetical protein RBS80_25540 [Thermoguttaceae bacterium]|jgi:hypothetical protein|nr:hypothetical protein [Thermoguttaceae bacterium]